jgi:hypothetical protein
LGVHNGSSLALIPDTDNLVAKLELAALRSGREGLQESDLALTIEDPARVELWDIWDSNGCLGGVEVDYFLGCAFECWFLLDG